MAELQRTLERLSARLTAMEMSFSWRITRPLRAATKWLRASWFYSLLPQRRHRLVLVAVGQRIEVTFSLRMNVVPTAYFLNAGVGGHVDGQFVYLARRVDVEMIRVIPADRRARYGITEVEHRFSWKKVAP